MLTGHLIRSLLLAALSVLVAWPVGYFVAPWAGWAFFSAGLAGQMVFHYRNFARLERWSQAPVVDDALAGDGAWDGIFARLYRHEKEMRDRLAQREDEYGRMVAAAQALTDGVVILDAQGQIAFANVTAEAQLGISLQTDRGQPIVNLVRQPEFVDYLAAGEFARPLVLRSGRSGDLVLSIAVVPYATDLHLMQVKDVTQSDRLDRMRRDFVANVSHELRTPLTVLAGFLETLQEIDVEREERERYLALMSVQSRRMESIVQDLLALSSIESAPPPDGEVVDMASITDKLRRDAEVLSAGQHEITVDADPQLDLWGAESELLSVFGNLVANAVRYTPAGGRIRIIWRAEGKGAEFAVEDTGIGIEASHLPRLTERFYRVDRGRSREAGGTGLGLAIVKHALNRHQGVLDIRSTPGVGSRFAARFPASRVMVA